MTEEPNTDLTREELEERCVARGLQLSALRDVVRSYPNGHSHETLGEAYARVVAILDDDVGGTRDEDRPATLAELVTVTEAVLETTWRSSASHTWLLLKALVPDIDRQLKAEQLLPKVYVEKDRADHRRFGEELDRVTKSGGGDG